MSQRVSALTLSLGGAPKTWHIVPGYGLFHPDIPVPVPDHMTAAEAKKLSDDDGIPVRVGLVAEHKASEGAKALERAKAESRNALQNVAPRSGEELDRIQDERAAVSGQED